MKEYTTIQLTKSMKKKLLDLRYELRTTSFEKVIEILLKIKNIVFIMKREEQNRKVNGTQLYDKLKQGWIVKEIVIKKEE